MERRSRTSVVLRASKLDAVVCSSATEVLLLTGYWPVMGASIAVAKADGDVRVVVPEDEVELAEKTTAAEIVPYKPAGLGTLKSPVELLEEPLRSATEELGRAVVGLQMEQGVQPSSYAVSNRYRKSLIGLLKGMHAGAEFRACDELLEQMKARKTAKELELLQVASEVAAAGFERAEAAIRPGVRETEVAAELQAAFETTERARVLERSYGYFFCMSGPNSAEAKAAYARTRRRELREGDLVMIHANTCADGYWTDITRTYTVGEPTARQQEIQKAIDEARRAGLRAIRPGAAAKDVDHAVREVMAAHGLGAAFAHAAGHGVGFAAANSHGMPRIHPLSPDVLEEGMTFNLEPAAYFEDYGGMRHCDLVAVTEDGARVMTDF